MKSLKLVLSLVPCALLAAFLGGCTSERDRNSMGNAPVPEESRERR